MTKVKKCYSLDDDLTGRIENISLQRVVPVSEVITKYLEKGLSHEMELSAAERYHYQRKNIMNSLDSLMRLQGILQFEGSVRDKYVLSLYVCHGLSKHINRKKRENLLELGLFDVLNEISYWDMDVFKDLKAELRFFGRMQARYNIVYEK